MQFQERCRSYVAPLPFTIPLEEHLTTMPTATTKLDTTAFASLLTAERERTTTARAEVAAERAGLLAAAGEGTPAESDFSEDGGEGSTLTAEIARLEEVLSQLDGRLDEIDDALVRIASGTYGICRTCGGPIGEARLEAIPEATQCLSCKSTPPWARRGLR